MSELSREQIGAIRERAAKATPGPWEYTTGFYGWDMGIFPVGGKDKLNGSIIANNGHANGDPLDEDATFIAHAREDIPALLVHIETLEALLHKGAEQGALMGEDNG